MESSSKMNENQNQNRQYVVTRSPKSVGLGLILTLVLGPIGLFYATITGGVIMAILDTIFAIAGFMTLGISLFITVPLVNLICMVWAYKAITNYNEDLFNGNFNV